MELEIIITNKCAYNTCIQISTIKTKNKNVITLNQYNDIKKYFKPVFIIFLILFFAKEISFLTGIIEFIQVIPDLLFLFIFLIYFIIEFLPIFKPDWIEGYEPPKNDKKPNDELLFGEINEKDEDKKDIDAISL